MAVGEIPVISELRWAVMWHWDQGRLNYFQFDELRKIAKFAIDNDLRLTDRATLEAVTGLPFSPDSEDYKPWRNYGRVFQLAMIATPDTGDGSRITEIGELLADDGKITTDDYFHFIAQATTDCPSHLFHPSQKPWNFASPPDTLSGMHKIIEIFADRAALHTEILALRQQVAVLKRKRPRPLLRKADRVFWVILSCLWPGWRHALVIVRPETVIGWHRKGFRLFWTWKSRRGKPGRPPVSREIRHLVRRMSRENTRWGAPRIHGELLKLGFSISQAAVSKYMVRYPSPPSQSWRTFLTNHADCLASIDFFVVPTATFHLLFGFIVLHHERRQIMHFGVTANPTMAWVAQQIREAFPWGTAPRYLIRDRDGAYGQSFRSTVTAMGVEEVVTAPRSPWQNPYVERLIGSVRRECLDHSIILNERHLRRILGSYLDYYHGSRTHLSLGKDTPDGRPVQPAGSGTVVSLPKVGGLHHRYERLAA